MLSNQQFQILYRGMTGNCATARDYAQATGYSEETINSQLYDLRKMGLVDSKNAITPAGEHSLAPYKVDNAIIMAAGLSSRFAPISYEKPKGLITVKGEVLIERQIRQLQEAGITDITVVVGYMKEEFFYLEDLFGVRIVINPDFSARNNNSTIRRISHLLGNTYVCSSDDYFTENPFEPYVYEAYYAAVFEEGPTDEYCLQTRGKNDRIVGVTIGGQNSWIMMGHTYWDKAFSATFVRILNEIYDQPETAGKLWEDIYIDHINELSMVMRTYEHGVIWEFDSLAELQEFDPLFLDNLDSSIMRNICTTLGCGIRDIREIVPIKQGLTNLSFKFEVAGEKYVYRHPGAGTDEIISRQSEAFSQKIGHDLGLDDTFIYEDCETGWKISRFIDDCHELDYHNAAEVEQALRYARTLHTCGISSSWSFDIWEKTLEIIDMLNTAGKSSFRDFDELYQGVSSLQARIAETSGEPCLCHNDFYSPNFLVTDEKMYLIDWEYSGMSDYASDLGTFVCCSDYTVDEAKGIFALYFGRELTDAEMFHCLGYVCLSSYYWFVWALYKDMQGDSVGDWLYLWYRYAKSYLKAANELN